MRGKVDWSKKEKGVGSGLQISMLVSGADDECMCELTVQAVRVDKYANGWVCSYQVATATAMTSDSMPAMKFAVHRKQKKRNHSCSPAAVLSREYVNPMGI